MQKVQVRSVAASDFKSLPTPVGHRRSVISARSFYITRLLITSYVALGRAFSFSVKICRGAREARKRAGKERGEASKNQKRCRKGMKFKRGTTISRSKALDRRISTHHERAAADRVKIRCTFLQWTVTNPASPLPRLLAK